MKQPQLTEKVILRSRPTAEEESTLLRAEIEIKQGLPRAYYRSRILAKISGLLDENRARIGSDPNWDWLPERWEELLPNPLWIDAIDFLQTLLDAFDGPAHRPVQLSKVSARQDLKPLFDEEDLARWAEPVDSDELDVEENRRARLRESGVNVRKQEKEEPLYLSILTGIDDQMPAVHFTQLQRYNGGIFNDLAERVLFEHFLWLHQRFVKRGRGSFFKSHKRMTFETAVPDFTLRKFIRKLQHKDYRFLEVKRGEGNRNLYSLQIDEIRKRLKDIYPGAYRNQRTAR